MSGAARAALLGRQAWNASPTATPEPACSAPGSMAAAEPPHSSSSGGDHRLPTIAVTFVGALGAGKTSLVVRISSGTFAVAYRPTLSLDFEFATRVKSGQTFSLGLRDTSGEPWRPQLLPRSAKCCAMRRLAPPAADVVHAFAPGARQHDVSRAPVLPLLCPGLRGGALRVNDPDGGSRVPRARARLRRHGPEDR